MDKLNQSPKIKSNHSLNKQVTHKYFYYIFPFLKYDMKENLILIHRNIIITMYKFIIGIEESLK